jgi:hypothetical protein
MTENVFPKVKGSKLYASEINKFGYIQDYCDIALLNTTNIAVKDIIGSNFKVLDLFTDYDGSKNTISYDSTAIYHPTALYFYCNITEDAEVVNSSFETGDLTGWSASANYPVPSVEDRHSHHQRYVAKIKRNSGGVTANNNIDQTINLTGINKLVFFYDVTINTAYVGTGAYISVDGDETGYRGTTGKGVCTLDVSAYTGDNSVSFISRSNSNTVTQYIDNIIGYSSLVYLDSFILSDTEVVGTGHKYAFIRPKLYEALPAGTSLKCEISLDDGATWSGEEDVDTYIDISGLNDTGNLKVKLHLKTDGTDTPKVLGWCCALFK